MSEASRTDEDYRIDRYADFESPQLVWLKGYWEEKCAGRRFPFRADIDSGDLVDILPVAFLYRVVDGGHDFLNLYTGRDLVDPHRGQGKQTLVSKLPYPPRVINRMMLILGRAYHLGVPIRGFSDRSLMFYEERFETGCFPLSEDGSAVSIIMGATIRTPRNS